MARRRRMSRKAAAGFAYASAVGGLASRYHQAKREYHRLGDALFKQRHGGRSARKRRSKHRRSR